MAFEEIAPALVANCGGPSVEPTMSVNRTVARMRSLSATETAPVKNSSIASPICSWMKKR